MSKIEKLLKELCPNGVEFKALGEVCERQKGINITAGEMEKIATKNGDIRIFAGGKTFVDTKKEFLQEQSILKKTSIIVKSRGYVDFEYYKKPFTHKSEIWSYSLKDEKVNLKFIFYYLKNKVEYFQKIAKANAVKIPQLAVADTDKFQIPIPPLEVQEEIVKILDTFTELERELERELESHIKQYEYYRNKLLSLEYLESSGGYELKTLGEIGKISMCRRIFKEQTSEIGEIPFYKVGTFGGIADAFIDIELFKEFKNKYPYPKIGEVLLSASGTIGRAIIYSGEDAYYQDSNIVWIENNEKELLNRFLFYFYQNIRWENHYSKGGTIARLYNDNLKKIQIPIPPLATQEKIVSILDKFHALTTDLTSGIPAELEARKKQYEYYRNKLLTFKEAR
ncbi:restriction endonuclease subunit S [Helicobacter trogontum]|uniref:restriction endonuclease subunit S n=1 Tax=Helicobacter trogontum TaxID=50960 RepID=UPI002A91B1C0|nr:restriction endonuclease subunit S [Helicobacter trogontum]MDY5185249.1 restriction endonuclease subunit S [Helicobacter trogontum]